MPKQCRLCGAHDLRHSLVDLGMSPLCESFITADQLDQMEAYYPLHASVCDRCFLVQLREYVSPDAIFKEYAYFSSYSTSWVEHARSYCVMIKNRLELGTDSLVVELASNDGYLLQHFRALGVPVLGIEPAANVAKAALERNVPTLVEFFGTALAHRLVSEGRAADLIVGNNVLAQVPDLNDFVAGMVKLLAPEGVITLEFPHLINMITENQFDTIYHEHFSYFSFVTVRRLASNHGLKVFDVEKLKTHGGSLRVYMAHSASSHTSTARVEDLLEQEIEAGLLTIETYDRFAERVRATKRKLLSFLIACKNDNKRICAYGAPGKGNTLLNYCGIGPDFVDFAVDRNPHKHGRFTPGMHIPIRPVEAISEAKPDYLLVLPWNLKEEIIQQMHHVTDWGCQFIIPIPEVHVVNPGQRRP